MNRTKFHLIFLAVALLSWALQAPALQTPGPPVTISGKVIGASGKHPVYVALWDARGFLSKPVQQIRLETHAAAEFQFHVPAGEWALSAYEDVNENGILDMGVFGPKEPSGFWRPFHAWRKPRFSDVGVHVTGGETKADIALQK